MMHSEKEYQRGTSANPGSHPGSRHQSIGSTDSSSIIALAEYLQAQQVAQLAVQQLVQGPIDLSGGAGGGPSRPTITLEQLSNIHHYRNTHHHQSEAVYDGSLLGSMLQSQHYHHLNGPPSPGSPVAGYQNPSPATSAYNGHHGSGSMSPTKKLSKPLIEKRRRDRINRCLRLLKELVIDSKRFPVANLSKSRFEKADILEITVKYLMTIQQEERRAFQQGFNTCHQEVLKLVQELTQNKEEDGSKEEAMVQGEEEDVTLEEAPAPKSSSNNSTSGADLNMVKQLCSRLTLLGEQISAEQQAHAQRTASLTNLVLELSELKSRSASITSDHSGEVTPTSLGQREHLAQSPSIEDLLQLDGMRLSDDEPSPLIMKQYFSRQSSTSKTPSTSGSTSGVIKHTSNYHPQEGSGGQVKTSEGHWAGSNVQSGNAQAMLTEGNLLQAYHHRSSSLSTAKSTSSSASSSSSSSSTSSTSATGPSATSFFKPGQPVQVDPSLCNFTQSPFFTELNMSGGNERNSGAMSNYEAIWRPWGFNA